MYLKTNISNVIDKINENIYYVPLFPKIMNKTLVNFAVIRKQHSQISDLNKVFRKLIILFYLL